MIQENSAFLQAREMMQAQLAREGRVVAALEGGAATGKTTLAGQLAEAFQAPVIPMDDFFLPPALRTAARLALPGGNIDSDRFNAQIAEKIRAGAPIAYQPYDCHQDRLLPERRLPPCPVLLVEGVYSLHPLYRDIYTLRLLVTAAPETQDARLRGRGAALYRRFQQEWLPMERAYFASEDFPALCQAVLET